MGADVRVAKERDLFGELLEFRSRSGAREVVSRVLGLLVEITGAGRGYVEVFESRDNARPRWTLTHGCTHEDEDEIRSITSRGIIAAALASGTTLHVPYAALDDRFAHMPSVREQRLEAVLCVPLTVGAGVLYLEGKRGHGPFAEPDLRLAETVARHLSPSLDRVGPADTADQDPTQPFRRRLRLDGIVGKSASLASVFAQVEPYVPREITVLITGANGTGKSQLARAIHENSSRRNGPFVELNCAAIPEGLIESELFGTMPSAFPGARRNPGKVEAAEGGTLFLDEIVEIPYQAQGKLLQLVQSHQYYALASTKLATANLRLIAATNADVPALVAEKRFREDLFYRISVVDVRMPSLHERREDIPLLVDQLLVRIADEHRIARLPASEQFRVMMEHRDWPGNIRQLRNLVERALIRANAENAEQVELRHVPDAAQAAETPATYHQATRNYQRELLKRELASTNWNVTAVAERLELTRSHIYNLIRQFELARTDPP